MLLGVSGGIAAYKSPDLVRRLRERDCDVRVVMTRNARELIAPLTLQAVSGHPVHTELFDPQAEAAMGHIELARWAETIVIAPATADLIARLAHGLADDLLTTLCLASEARLALAPAMNRVMWDAPATRVNVTTLVNRGTTLLGPGDGAQACGEVGPGRMLDPEEIARRLFDDSAAALAGLTVLVTAGPTREAIDPVRFITNHSSGKMGYAVARAAAAAGARVALISGPTTLAAPAGVDRSMITSAAEMHTAVMERVSSADIFIAAAAVADYRPAAYQPAKIKKGEGAMALDLDRTPDILAAVAKLPQAPFTVGFAAETEDLETNARAKLERKGLDLIAANRVSGPHSAFGADHNALSLYWRDGATELARANKNELARRLVEVVAEHYHRDRDE